MTAQNASATVSDAPAATNTTPAGSSSTGARKRPARSKVARTAVAKECTICHQMLPLGQYHRTAGVPDGRRSECKKCFMARRAQRVAAARGDDRHERQRKRRAKELQALVADVVAPKLNGALCLDKWALFDAADSGDDPLVVEELNRQAITLCRRCLALTDCGAWLNSLPRTKRPTGVVAGQIITHHETGGTR